jgi:hypothetical protein
MTAPRVLCYSPSNRWGVHGQWDMTIAHGLRARGADVRYVMCDGLFSDCDVYWASLEDRPADACIRCQAGVAALAADNQMPYQWLGRHLDPKESREARRWVSSLARDELPEAAYDEWRIAEWVRGSIHSHFRRSRLDVTDPAVERTMRSYLFSGLTAAFALDRLLEDYAPDVMLLFNGRQSSTRVAFELARKRGIRTVCHERGPRRGTIRLTVDRTIVAHDQFTEYWTEWGDVPLSAPELRAITGHLAEREHGVNTGCVAFSPAPQERAATRETLGLHADRPAWVLFTSSDDEVAAEPDWRAAWSQTEWVAHTIGYARRHPELDLVVRLHPNTGSRRSIGANVQQLAALEALRVDLPANVRWVAPDDEVSSYTLMDLCTVGLVSHSTVGLELATKGKRVVVTAPNFVVGRPFVVSAQEPVAYEAALDAATSLAPGSVDTEIRRQALRFAYGLFYRQPVQFPLVASRQDATGERNWSSPAELVPGHDAGLDRCTAIVLDAQPACLPPDPAALARDAAFEERFLAGREPVVVLAFAEELIADVSLLETWGSSFSAGDDATLVIYTPEYATEALLGAVSRAGLDSVEAPDMVAVTDGATELDEVVAILSRGSDVDLPRMDSVAGLRALAGLAL